MLLSLTARSQIEVSVANPAVEIVNGRSVGGEFSFCELNPLPIHPFHPAVAETSASALVQTLSIAAKVFNKRIEAAERRPARECSEGNQMLPHSSLVDEEVSRESRLVFFDGSFHQKPVSL